MQKILLDLDSLLDTRLGVLSTLNPEAARRVVTTPDYWEREHTDWSALTDGMVTNEAFEAAWLARTTADLQQSVVTGILTVVARILAEYNINLRDGVTQDDIGLDINIHPYTLEADELEELDVILRQSLYSDLVITFCSRPLEEITPQVLNEEYAAVILFEFHRWIKHHCFNLGKQRCPDLNMIVPRLFEKDPTKLSVESKQDEILGFRLWLSTYLDFEFIDAQWFSMFRPPRPNAT